MTNHPKFIFHDVETLKQFSPVFDVIRYSHGYDAANDFAEALVAKQFPIRVASPLVSAFNWMDATRELGITSSVDYFSDAHRRYNEMVGYTDAFSSPDYVKRIEELRELGVATEVDPETGESIKRAVAPEPVETSPLSKDFQVGGDHYSKLTIQPWDVMRETMSHEGFCGFLHGNVIKYVMRDKNGVEDLKKAQHYLSVLIAEIEGADDGQA